MRKKTNEVTALEAKTHLAALLRETEQGRSFVIKRRGKAVAMLVPPSLEKPHPDWKQFVTWFREIREQIPGPLNVRELIEEGRRF